MKSKRKSWKTNLREMARIYTNENFYLDSVKALRQLGHDVLAAKEAGNANLGIPDEEVLKFAKSENRIVLTLNRRHFVQLHRLHPLHPGIIVCTEDKDVEGLANRIHQALEAVGGNLENQLLRIVRPNPSRKD